MNATTLKERLICAGRAIARRRSIFLSLSGLYLLIVLGVYTYMYNGNPFAFYTAFPVWFTVTQSVLNVLISALLGLTLTLMIAHFRVVRAHSAGFGIAGMLFGGVAMGCPGCFFGLFPIMLGFFGVTGTLAILPWNGIEFQLLTLVLLGLSALSLAKEPSAECALPAQKR